VQEAEARLEELLLRFTDRHPEVLALRQTIAELKGREARELAELARGGAGTGAIRSLNVNPVYQSIQTQLSQVDVELASLRGAASQHRREIAELRRFVDSAPEVEQEFARLNRDYTVQRAQYQQLVERLERARVSDDAAQNGIVRFDVIEPPRAGSDSCLAQSTDFHGARVVRRPRGWRRAGARTRGAASDLRRPELAEPVDRAAGAGVCQCAAAGRAPGFRAARKSQSRLGLRGIACRRRCDGRASVVRVPGCCGV
jgi:hypothetical protein